MIYKTIKRLVDFISAVIGSLVLMPVFVVLVFLVYLIIGRPVLFRQQRPGLHGQPFTMLKFRTMTNEQDTDGTLLPDDQRLTKFGKFLRSTSLDEVPGLINVLKGEMSLVGPRPLLMRYLDRYSVEQARRHDIRPGVTGWAQVNGRNAISWEEKFDLDIWYVDNQSFRVDIKILWMTFVKVFKRDGISQAGEATMEEFWGSKD